MAVGVAGCRGLDLGGMTLICPRILPAEVVMPPKKSGKKKLSGRAGTKFSHIDNSLDKAAAGMGRARPSKAKPVYSVSDLVAKAEHFLERLEPELALQFYVK